MSPCKRILDMVIHCTAGKNSSSSRQLKVLLFKLATLSATRSDINALHNRAQQIASGQLLYETLHQPWGN